MKTEQQLLREQIDDYRARASKYDDWFYRRDRYRRGPEHTARWKREAEQVRAWLRARLRPPGAGSVAGGTAP